MSIVAPKDLSDEELSQQLYNCAAFLTSACEEDETESEVSLELVALLLLRAKDIVVELAGGESLEALALKADDEDRKILEGTAAAVVDVPEDEPA